MAGPATLYQAGDHASRPASGSGCVLYSCTDHDLVYRDDGSSWTTFMTLVGGSGGDVATDTIWDSAGDLAVGSGANTAAKLAIGATNGMALRRVSGAVAWDLPPGHEFDYAAITSDVTITGRNEGAANTIVTGASVAYDGSTAICIDFFAARASVAAVGGEAMVVVLLEGSTVLGRIAVIINPSASASIDVPVRGGYRYTPAAGSRSHIVKAYTSSANGTMYAASGGTGAQVPAFLRITKA